VADPPTASSARKHAGTICCHAAGRPYGLAMATPDPVRSAAAIELADALLAEFNDPSSALKGVGRVTMEKLLAYQKLIDRAQRRRKPDAPPAAE
jgi:hypothetical protein